MSGPVSTFVEAVTTAALLGTQRGGSAIPQSVGAGMLPGGLGERVSGLAREDVERWILDAAAMGTVWERAGWTAPVVGGPGALAGGAAGEERLPVCSAGAAGILARMLRGEHGEMLGEWLELARERGVRVREDLLPDLLEAGARVSEWRRGIAAVVGERGGWLARQNRAWGYAVGAGDVERAEEAWQTGTRDERVALLREVRRVDPARGLGLVRSTWESDSPEERAKFLEELREGLSMGDEPLLEAALDDKRKPVRTAAAELLLTLPESRLVGRMIERAEGLLAYEAGKKGKLLRKGGEGRVVVSLPEVFDKSMARDGMEQKVPGPGIGERAWWLRQIVERVPPRVWSERWGASVEEIIHAKVEDNHGELLHVAWAIAAGRAGEVEWMAALMAEAGAEVGRAWGGGGAFATMRGDLQQIVAQRLLERDEPSMSVANWLAHTIHTPWTPEFSRCVMSLLRRATQERSKNLKSSVHPLLLHPSHVIHPAVAGELVALILSVHERHPMSIDPSGVLAALEMRAAISREFGA